MLGNATLRLFAESESFETWGTLRSLNARRHFKKEIAERLEVGIDVLDDDVLAQLFQRIRPNLVINCVGIVKQLAQADDPLVVLPINSLLPHRLARRCMSAGARLIHVSTDCVFSGKRGHYTEDDVPDATDLYGRSKLLGEVDYHNAITLRTSIIGHELESANALIDWFLAQHGSCKGYVRAVFSGLPAIVLARLMRDVIVRHPSLHGLYHVSAQPIDKYSLLRMVADAYGKRIDIIRDDAVVVDRSLDSTRFRNATGWNPPTWPELIQAMHLFH